MSKLSQWLFKKNYLLERSIGHILHMSVNTNSFAVQCSVIASAALTRDRVLHVLPRKKKFYSLNFHVIDIKDVRSLRVNIDRTLIFGYDLHEHFMQLILKFGQYLQHSLFIA